MSKGKRKIFKPKTFLEYLNHCHKTASEAGNVLMKRIKKEKNNGNK